jgi:hypothetical protein
VKKTGKDKPVIVIDHVEERSVFLPSHLFNVNALLALQLMRCSLIRRFDTEQRQQEALRVLKALVSLASSHQLFKLILISNSEKVEEALKAGMHLLSSQLVHDLCFLCLFQDEVLQARITSVDLREVEKGEVKAAIEASCCSRVFLLFSYVRFVISHNSFFRQSFPQST